MDINVLSLLLSPKMKAEVHIITARNATTGKVLLNVKTNINTKCLSVGQSSSEAICSFQSLLLLKTLPHNRIFSWVVGAVCITNINSHTHHTQTRKNNLHGITQRVVPCENRTRDMLHGSQLLSHRVNYNDNNEELSGLPELQFEKQE
ncbi:hypothetical protein SFRURICE_014967 [Spodoptera frugiperda]|nr:hypothetical protein SFRURICE_014967 [Spodoptera frugiperda]